jgi:AAA domain
VSTITASQVTQIKNYINQVLPQAGMVGDVREKVAAFAVKHEGIADLNDITEEQASDLLGFFEDQMKLGTLVQHIDDVVAPKALADAPTLDAAPDGGALAEQQRKANEDLFPEIPDIFKQYNNWLTFESAEKKAPIISGTFAHGKSNDSATWVSYPTLLQNIRAGKGYRNVGFCPDGERTGYLTAIDIDNSVNIQTGEIAEWAQRILKSLGATYVEVTVSGSGLRAWVVIERDFHTSFDLSDTAKANPTKKAAQIEVVNDKQYMTFSRAVLAESVKAVRELSEADANAFFQLLAELQKEFPAISTNGTNGIDASPNGEKIPRGKHDSELHRIAGKLRSIGLEEEAIYTSLVEICEKRCENHDEDYRDMARKHARNIVKKPVGDGSLELNQKPDADSPAGKQATQTNATANLNIVTADKVETKKVRWLWDKRVPFGKLTVFAGNPDEAKSLVSLYVAAQLTRGQRIFDSDTIIPPSEVLIMAAEDEPNDTIVPRLMAAEADLSKVHILQSVILKDGQGQTSDEREIQLDTDIKGIENFVVANPDIRLIIIDPISSYLGDTKMGGEKEIRRLLNPLRTFAARTGISIVMIMHFNKSVEASAIHRVGGAVAFTGVARAVWAFMSDPADEANLGLRKMLKVKANLAATSTGGLTYEVKTRPVQIEGEYDYQPYVAFVGKTDKTASDLLMSGKAAHRPDTEKTDAKEWLQEFMSENGAEAASDVQSFGRKEGHSLRTLYRAKDELGYVSEKLGRKWYWKRPEVDLEADAPKAPKEAQEVA